MSIAWDKSGWRYEVPHPRDAHAADSTHIQGTLDCGLAEELLQPMRGPSGDASLGFPSLCLVRLVPLCRFRWPSIDEIMEATKFLGSAGMTV
jgi:hypothetical protein